MCQQRFNSLVMLWCFFVKLMFFRKFKLLPIIFQIIGFPKRFFNHWVGSWFIRNGGVIQPPASMPKCDFAPFSKKNNEKTDPLSVQCTYFEKWSYLPIFVQILGAEISQNFYEPQRNLQTPYRSRSIWSTTGRLIFIIISIQSHFGADFHRGVRTFLGLFEKFNRVPLVRCTYLFVKSSWYCMLILRI